MERTMALRETMMDADSAADFAARSAGRAGTSGGRVARLAALAGVLLAELSLSGAAIAAAPAPAEEPRLVTTNGVGEIRAQPDMATVTIGVLARKPTLEAARQEANRVQAALLAMTRELQIPNEKVQSTRVSASPEYTWNEPKRKREFVAYVVQRQVVVEVRDLEKLGSLMEKSLTAGANQVNDPVLDSSKRKELERQALALAVDDARRNADVLARAVGMSVGTARNVTGNGAFQPPSPMAMYKVARAVAADAPVESPETYQTGEMVFTANANIVWDLVPAAK
jgi:uncharacterized protein YggE